MRNGRASAAAVAYREGQKHPVREILKGAAFGDLPTEDELDALKLPPAQRHKVAASCTVVASIKASGENQYARERAREAADEIVDALPENLRRPDYLRAPDPSEPTDPAGLAAKVQRW